MEARNQHFIFRNGGGVNLVSVTFFKFLNGLGQGMDFKSRNFKGKIVLLLHAEPHDVTCSAAALL